jgi:putative integral membrane protein (TIGR02587 family)
MALVGEKDRTFLRAAARAAGGALLFALPLLMTMEMWHLGFTMDELRLALFLALTLPVLVGLGYYAGFEATFSLSQDTADAFTAFGIGAVVSGLALAALGVIRPNMPAREVVGMIAVQAVPASIGAILARVQMGGQENEERREDVASYPGELFLMGTGALFLAFNVAPTEEMILISFKMTPWHALALALASILLLHVFVYTVGFGGQEEEVGGSGWRAFKRFTLAGYGLALLISLYVLWTFGRTDGISFMQTAMATVVLGFPAAIGAAVARLVV